MPARVPSVKFLRDAFAFQMDDSALALFRRKAKTGTWRHAADAANTLLEGHGVEAIRCPSRGLLAVYVNTGDTYSTTLLCHIPTGAWRVTTWGDYVEAFERRHGRKASESLCGW